jgi:hypothetical protein
LLQVPRPNRGLLSASPILLAPAKLFREEDEVLHAFSLHTESPRKPEESFTWHLIAVPVDYHYGK